MKTLIEVLQLSAIYLKDKGISNPKRQAEELLCDFFKWNRLDLYLKYDQPIEPNELALFRERLARRGKGEPIAYIAGQTEFFGCTIHVNPGVLIPRQETEILVEKIANQLSQQDLRNKQLWDVCCGSGCIGISLKKRFPELVVVLSDISQQALDVARHNAQINGVEVELLQGDLLLPFQGRKADFIVSNPPYISEQEFQSLDKEVKFEPKGALVSGVHGTEFYEKFALELPEFLNSSGCVWFEIGYQQGERVKKIFINYPWKHCRFENDWAGHHRFFFLEKE